MKHVLLMIIIGAASGFAQFKMLSMFTKAVTGGAMNVKTVLLGVCQFFLPLAVLLGCALLFPDCLLWTAVGMAAALIGCSLTRFLLQFKQR